MIDTIIKSLKVVWFYSGLGLGIVKMKFPNSIQGSINWNNDFFKDIFPPTSEGRKEPREGPRPVLPRSQSASSSCLCKQPRWRWRSSRGCRWTRWWWWRMWRQRRAWVSSCKHSLHCNIRNNTQILTMVPPCQREQLKRRRESKIRPTCLIRD